MTKETELQALQEYCTTELRREVQGRILHKREGLLAAMRSIICMIEKGELASADLGIAMIEDTVDKQAACKVRKQLRNSKLALPS